MISIKKTKEIREDLNLTHLVIFGISEDGVQHVATHGKSKRQAKEAADAGNRLKKNLQWPDIMCHAEPLERICGNCDYWQKEYHRPGGIIKSNRNGQCMYAVSPVDRYEKDIACVYMEIKE